MSSYDAGFYEGQRMGSATSAAVVLPVVFDLVGALDSMLDVGCGVGTWLAEARKRGLEDLQGVDGDYVDRRQLAIDSRDFLAHDLATPLDLGRRFGLVISLEVAEHLPEAAATTFVRNITGHGDLVMFSAACPGQGGTGHITERWPSFWIEKFEAEGYRSFDVLRPLLWDAPVEPWYAQNILLFARGAEAERIAGIIEQRALSAMGVTNVVHPNLYELAIGDGRRTKRALRSTVRSLLGGRA